MSVDPKHLGRFVPGRPAKPAQAADVDLALLAANLNDALVLKVGQDSADGFQREAEVIADLAPGHRHIQRPASRLRGCRL